MARLIADRKFGYFPAPPNMVEAFAARIDADPAARIYDGMAGQGEALKTLVQQTGATGWANELVDPRFDITRRLFPDHTLHGDFFSVAASKRFASFAWVNPPYSLDNTQHTGDDKRREIQYLRRVFEKELVQANGYVAYIVYRQHITAAMFALFARFCLELQIWAWDDLILGEYKHVIVMAKVDGRKFRRDESTERAHAWKAAWEAGQVCSLHDPATETLYHLPAPIIPESKVTFRQDVILADDMIAAANAFGGQKTPAYRVWAMPEIDLENVRPAVQPVLAHLLTLMQGGLLDKAFITMEDGLGALRAVIRYEDKEIAPKQAEAEAAEDANDEAKGKGAVIRVRKQMRSDLYVTKASGEVVHLNTTELIRDFMLKYRDQLFDYVNTVYTPHFNVGAPADHPHKAPWLEHIKPWLVKGQYRFFEAQKLAINAGLHLLYGEPNKRGVYFVFEPSYGKSPISCAIAGAITRRAMQEKVKSLVGEHLRAGTVRQGDVIGIICPGNLLDKWEGEIVGMLPQAHVYKACLTDAKGHAHDILREVAAFMREAEAAPFGSLYFLIMHQDSIKFGEGTALAVNYKRRTHETIDPIAGTWLDDEDLDERGKKLMYASRGEFIGYTTVDTDIDDDETGEGETLSRLKKVYRETENQHIACWQEQRLYRKPDEGNGRVVTEETWEDHPIKSWRWDPRTKTVVLHQRPHQVLVKTIVENLTGEEILDPWLAMKGTHYALNPRAPLWRILKRHFDQQISLLFIDEAHGAATTSTDIYQSTAHIAMTARKIIALTATLSRGYASSLYGLETIMNKRALFARYPWGDAGQAQWVHDMGVLEAARESEDKEERGAFTRVKRKTDHNIHEVPGTTAVAVRWVLDHAVFMSLADLGKVLVPYQEDAIETHMEGDHLDFYSRIAAICDEYGDQYSTGAKISRLIAFNYLMAATNSPFTDMPLFAYEKKEGERFPHKVHVGTVSGIGDGDSLLNKEAALIDKINEVLPDRGICVYVNQTGKRGYQPRLKRLIEKFCPKAKVAVLTARITQVRREAWINKQAANGVNVLITNPDLVKEGLDLLAFQIYWWHEHSTKLITTVQASHRGLRIPQTKPCEVWFPFYEGNDSVEAKLVVLMAKKLKAHAVLNGNEISLLDNEDDDNDLLSEISEGINTAKVDLKALFREINEQYEKDYGASALVMHEVEVEPEAAATPLDLSRPLTDGEASRVAEAFFTQPAIHAAFVGQTSAPIPPAPAISVRKIAPSGTTTESDSKNLEIAKRPTLLTARATFVRKVERVNPFAPAAMPPDRMVAPPLPAVALSVTPEPLEIAQAVGLPANATFNVEDAIRRAHEAPEPIPEGMRLGADRFMPQRRAKKKPAPALADFALDQLALF